MQRPRPSFTLSVLWLALLAGCGRTTPDRGSQTPPPAAQAAPAPRAAAPPASAQRAPLAPLPPADPTLLAALQSARGSGLCDLKSRVSPTRDLGLVGPALDRVHALRRDEASRDCGFELLTALGTNAALADLARRPATAERWAAMLAWANRNLRAKLWQVYALGLEQPDAAVRGLVASGLGNHGGDPEVLELLRQALSDPVAEVRRRAARALAEVGGPQAQAVAKTRIDVEQDPAVLRALHSAAQPPGG